MTPDTRHPTPDTRNGERGYVLMVFMLFAALLLVSGSTIVRQAAFEGRRLKEEELVFRGLQYHRAVQLFFRKFGRYPNSVDELVKTNNIRFLRKRYADPMTKEGEWRLIHVGPNGAFVDAQTSPLQMPRAPGQQGASPTQQGGTSQPTMQPAGQAAQGGFQSSFGQNPGQQPAMGLSPISSSAGGSPLPQGLAPQPGQGTQPALSPSASPSAFPQAQAGGSVFGQQPQSSTPSAAQPQPIGGSQPGSTTGGLQTFGGMAIAGFASTAKGSSIRVWNGYDDYSKWEFIYDFRQDQLAMARFAAQVQTGTQVQPGQMPPGTQPGMQPPGFQPPGFQPPGTAQPGFQQPGFQPRPGSPPFTTPGMPGMQQPGPGVPPFTPPGTGPGTPFSPTPGALPPPRTR